MQFVLGVKNALPAAEHLVDVLLDEKNRVLPNATWTAAGIGAFQAPAIGWALKRGAQSIRTGLNAAPERDYRNMSSEEFRTLEQQFKKAFRSGKRLSL